MHRQLGHRHHAGRRAQQLPGFCWRPDPDGVAQRDLIAAEIPQRLRHVDDRRRFDLALIGTPQHTGDIPPHPDAVVPGAGHHRLEALDRFGDRAIDVGARERFRRRGEHRDLAGAGGARRLVALFVRHQHLEFAVGAMTDAAQHLVGIHHLRDRFRRHEGADLDRVQSGVQQRLDEGNAVGHADEALFVLQAVARTDFKDAHGIAHAGLTLPMVRFQRVRRLPARYRRPCI